MISAPRTRNMSFTIPYNKYLYKKWLKEIDEEIKAALKESTKSNIKYRLNYFEWRGHGFYHDPSPNTILVLLRKLRNLGYTANVQSEQDLSKRAPECFKYDYMYISW